MVCPRFAEGGTVGGAETLLHRLAERLVLAGRKVTFLTTCARDHQTWQNVLPPGPRTVDGLDVIYFPVDANRDVRLFSELQQAIGRGRPLAPDEEQAWLRNGANSTPLCEHLRSHGGEYDRILAGPYLFSLVYYASLIHPGKTLLVPCLHDEGFAYLGVMHTLFGSVAGCLFNSEPERDLAVRVYGCDPGQSVVCGMGFEAFEADPHAFARRHRLPRPYVMYSGRRETGKGVPLLTEYVHLFRQRTGRDIDLVFTGSGAIEAPEALWPHIHDFGFVSESELHEAMAGALAFVHPSIYESLGIVLLESFLARTPALVHAQSPVLRWQCQRSGAGLWFRQYPEFEEELLLLMEHADLRRRMGAHGREFVLREYTWEAVARRLLARLDR